ncbi:MAG: branched-chain amino acid aminotransferase [Firmicutes bacterium]|nr:branched-chain amino acid aminotransferase [Bacillota bacterium]
MKILTEELSPDRLKPLVDPAELGFGRYFTDRMLIRRFKDGRWDDPKIVPYQNFTLDPAARVLHYSQEIFEGLKAYAGDDGRIFLFRPEENARRMNRSAARMCMPTMPEEDFLACVTSLVVAEKRWIPRATGTSLYIRPPMIGNEAALGVHPSDEYLFFIILSPVGAYFKTGFKPVRRYVEDVYVRAVPGGVGDAKTGGNYAATLLAGALAEEKGFSQVLWLDARERRYVEEVGSMNIFFVFGTKLVTPALSGSILPGITRDSVLKLAPRLGYEVEERPIGIDEVIAGIEDGHLTEAFGTGTACVIAPVGGFQYKRRDYTITGEEVGPVTQRLYDELVGIQYGRKPDPFGWVKEIGRL